MLARSWFISDYYLFLNLKNPVIQHFMKFSWSNGFRMKIVHASRIALVPVRFWGSREAQWWEYGPDELWWLLLPPIRSFPASGHPSESGLVCFPETPWRPLSRFNLDNGRSGKIAQPKFWPATCSQDCLQQSKFVLSKFRFLNFWLVFRAFLTRHL